MLLRSGLFAASLAKEAKRKGKERATPIEFWYRQKYKLTKSDPRFLDATLEEMNADYWAHYYFDNPKAKDEIEDEDFNLEDELQKIEDEDSLDDADVDDWESVA